MLWWKFAKFFMSFSKPQVSFSSNFTFSSVMKDKSSVLFWSNVIYFAQKEPIKEQIFETFKCSGQNSPNSRHFWNNKSVSLQILHHCLVSWDITPLYFLAEIFNTFNKRSLPKYKFGEISREQWKEWNFAPWWAPFIQII